MTYDEKLAEWRSKLDTVGHHLIDVHNDRQIWREMVDAVVATQSPHGGYFADHYTKLYVQAASVAVRRLADPLGRASTVSLGRLLIDLRDSSGLLTRERHIALYAHDEDDRGWARAAWLERGAAAWDDSWADSDGKLDGRVITTDLGHLADTVAVIKQFTDRTVAHIDSRGVDQLPTFDDLDRAIDTLGELFKRYSLLLTGAGWAFLEPAIQGDWKAPFRQPIFEPVNRPTANDSGLGSGTG